MRPILKTLRLAGSSKVLFPDLPLPSKYRVVKRGVLSIIPDPTPASAPRVTKPKPVQPAPAQKRAMPTGLAKIDIPELTIGGELTPEPSKRQVKDDHVVEDLDLADYQ